MRAGMLETPSSDTYLHYGVISSLTMDSFILMPESSGDRTISLSASQSN